MSLARWVVISQFAVFFDPAGAEGSGVGGGQA